ncbi:unnamed protein product [Penicillium glandicola]
MAESGIRSLQESELEVLMNLRYRAARRTQIRNFIQQESQSIRLLVAFPQWELNSAYFCAIVGAVVQRLQAFNEELRTLQIEEQEDDDIFERVCIGDNA